MHTLIICVILLSISVYANAYLSNHPIDPVSQHELGLTVDIYLLLTLYKWEEVEYFEHSSVRKRCGIGLTSLIVGY